MKPRKETHLMARWSKALKDIVYEYPGQRIDARLLHSVFSCSRPSWRNPSEELRPFVEELEARGYDLTTLRFSIALKATPSPGAGTKGDREP